VLETLPVFSVAKLTAEIPEAKNEPQFFPAFSTEEYRCSTFGDHF
jgi:hypothetical protein